MNAGGGLYHDGCGKHDGLRDISTSTNDGRAPTSGPGSDVLVALRYLDGGACGQCQVKRHEQVYKLQACSAYSWFMSRQVHIFGL